MALVGPQYPTDWSRGIATSNIQFCEKYDMIYVAKETTHNFKSNTQKFRRFLG